MALMGADAREGCACSCANFFAYKATSRHWVMVSSADTVSTWAMSSSKIQKPVVGVVCRSAVHPHPIQQPEVVAWQRNPRRPAAGQPPHLLPGVDVGLGARIREPHVVTERLTHDPGPPHLHSVAGDSPHQSQPRLPLGSLRPVIPVPGGQEPGQARRPRVHRLSTPVVPVAQRQHPGHCGPRRCHQPRRVPEMMCPGAVHGGPARCGQASWSTWTDG